MIGDDVTAALPELQRQAESMMLDTCTVTRPAGVTADPLTGADVETSDRVYSGRCRLQSSQTQVRDVQSNDGTAALQQSQVHLPVAAGPFQRGDVIAVGERRFRILGLPTKTFQTAQRLSVEEVL